MKTLNRFLLAAGLLLSFTLGFTIPSQSQQGAQVNQAAGQPWQFAQAWCFGGSQGCPGGTTQVASGSSVGPFGAKGILYWKLVVTPSGTVTGCSFSIDSSALGVSFTTGGFVSSGTIAGSIGTCSPGATYLNTSAVTPANFGQLTGSVTGNGSVTAVLFGYTENPASSGAIAGSVSVTSLPALPTGTNTIGSAKITDGTNVETVKAASTAPVATDTAAVVTLSPNSSAIGTDSASAPTTSVKIAGKNAGNTIPLAVDASGNAGVNIQNVTATGTASITNTQTAVVAAGGASQVAVVVSGTWTGTLQPKVSIDGSNYTNALVFPTFPSGSSASTITANGQWTILTFGAPSVEVVGNTVSSGTAVVTLVATPGPGLLFANIGLWAGSLLGAPSNSGTSPGAVLVPGVNANITNTPTVIGNQTPADAASTPTDAEHVQSWPMGWNGATSDRLRTAGVGNTVASTGLLAMAAYCEFLTALPTLTTGTYGAAQCDSSGRLIVTPASMMTGTVPGTAPAGTDIVGAMFNSARPAPSNGQSLPLQVDLAGNLFVTSSVTSASGMGLSVFSNAAVTTSVNVKASSGNIYGYQVVNGSASVCYLQFINSAGAGTLGTAFTFSVAIPGSGVNGGVFGPFIFPISQQTQATGIAVGLSTTQNGSSACGSSGVVTVWYK